MRCYVQAAMVSAIRTVGHEDRLSLVDHLDELRMRLIISGAVLAVAFGICLWQNHALLNVINKPLKSQTSKQVAQGHGTVGQSVVAQQGVLKVAHDTSELAAVLARPGSGLSNQTRQAVGQLQRSLGAAVKQIPRNPTGDNPATLGVGEPFTTTIMVSLYFALIISLPIILYELYGFVVPALNPRERRAIVPLLGAVPILFAIGVAFGYFLVLPAAIRFFVNFNSGEFNVIVQASQYYSFAATVLLAMGVMFQVPVVILGLTRMGIVGPRRLRKFRPYAVVLSALVAAILPGDAITMLLETVPLYLLYEASILLARFVTPAGEAAAAARWETATQSGEAAHPGAEPNVQELIDHVDPRL
jgi:sec-independent protein translocase protein TatC